MTYIARVVGVGHVTPASLLYMFPFTEHVYCRIREIEGITVPEISFYLQTELHVHNIDNCAWKSSAAHPVIAVQYLLININLIKINNLDAGFRKVMTKLVEVLVEEGVSSCFRTSAVAIHPAVQFLSCFSYVLFFTFIAGDEIHYITRFAVERPSVAKNKIIIERTAIKSVVCIKLGTCEASFNVTDVKGGNNLIKRFNPLFNGSSKIFIRFFKSIIYIFPFGFPLCQPTQGRQRKMD